MYDVTNSESCVTPVWIKGAHLCGIKFIVLFKKQIMKKAILGLLLLFMAFTITSSAQNTTMAEKYGKTLNLGLGIGYYGYVGGLIPVLHADYELDVARNFTLAPFINFYSYTNSYFVRNKNCKDLFLREYKIIYS